MRHDLQIQLLKDLLAKLDSGTNVDAGGFRKNPTSSYTDPELAELEWQRFFRAQPQLIGMSGDIPEPGSFMTMDDFGAPIIAVRDEGGRFRALVNACSHRGSKLEDRPRGTTRRFTCPFHAWTYSTEGALVGLPKADHFGQVDLDCHGLVELPAEERHGLLWVHPDPNGSLDAAAILGPELDAEIGSWSFAELEQITADTYDMPLNWKLAMDTFGETYHFPILHRDTLAMSFIGNAQCYETFDRHHRMVLCRRDIEQMREYPEDQWQITIGGLPVYFLFPNVQLIPNHYGLQLVRAYPVAGQPGRHVSQITFYVRPGHAARDEAHLIANNFAEVIRDEDYRVAAGSQEAADSGLIDHLIFGRNEPALHHYHNTFRQALDMEPLPLLDSLS
ncbi:MAG: aromatic ring-hydroxylating oxygenase subunit alpha [Acidimicrobiales bacterium]